MAFTTVTNAGLSTINTVGTIVSGVWNAGASVNW